MRRKIAMTVAAGALLAGPFLSAVNAQPARASQDATTNGPTPTPVIQPADCRGTTGYMGCGPGWVWNAGMNRCIPC